MMVKTFANNCASTRRTRKAERFSRKAEKAAQLPAGLKPATVAGLLVALRHGAGIYAGKRYAEQELERRER